MLVGLGTGFAAAMIVFLGVEVATGYGLVGLLRNRDQVDAETAEAKLQLADKLASATTQHQAALRATEAKISYLERSVSEKEDRLQGQTEAVRELENRLAQASKRADEQARTIKNLEAESQRLTAEMKGRPAEGKGDSAAAVLTRQSRPLTPDPVSLRRSSFGISRMTYTQEFASEPRIVSLGFQGVEEAALKANEVRLTTTRRGGLTSLGTLTTTRNGAKWAVELKPADKQAPTPVLQTGFVEIKAGDEPAMYYLTYQPQRFGPQTFDPSPAAADPNRAVWRCRNLQYDLARHIEDYSSYQVNGGALGFVGSARITADGAELLLAPPPDHAPDTPVHKLIGSRSDSEASLELDDDGALLLKTPKGTSAKAWTLDAVRVVRPLAKPENIRSDNLLVFEINPKHAAGGGKK